MFRRYAKKHTPVRADVGVILIGFILVFCAFLVSLVLALILRARLKENRTNNWKRTATRFLYIIFYTIAVIAFIPVFLLLMVPFV